MTLKEAAESATRRLREAEGGPTRTSSSTDDQSAAIAKKGGA